MSDINFQEKDWLRLREQYLKQIEEVLAESGQPSVESIVEDVRSHLDRRFKELSPMQRTWESYQAIITEMGPPSEYAELAGQKRNIPAKKISLGFVVTLAAVLLLLTAGLILLPMLWPKSPMPTWTDKIQGAFINEPELVGKWVSVDFVKEPNGFSLSEKQWPGDLYVKDITFNSDGTTTIGWSWTKGWIVDWSWTKGWIIDNGSGIKAEYEIRNISGVKYLFLPWLSGDVIIRHQKPQYYVLKKVSQTTQQSQNENNQATESAIKVARAWLQLVDEGRYGESWSQAAGYLKKFVSEEQLKTSLEAARKPLGKVLSRKVQNSTYTTALPGAPDGQYVVIQFETSFENKQNAVETITPMLEPDGQWRVSGYYIK